MAEFITISAAERLGVSRPALHKEFGKDLSEPHMMGGKPKLEWPKVEQEWKKHKDHPRVLRYEGREKLTKVSEEQAKQNISGPKVKAAPPEPSQFRKVQTVAAAVKVEQLKDKRERDKKTEPYALRAERAKAEKEETLAASARIELHLKAKTLMPVEELEDRLRERDSVIRDRFATMAGWIREQHPGASPAVLESIEEYCRDSLARLGQGILTDEEREGAKELEILLEERNEEEGLL